MKLHKVLVLVVCCCVGTLPIRGPTAVAEQPTKPNIVFILADDLGWGELGCYGQQKIPTPNIDRLAAEGMRFTSHYSGAPVCAPSRCVLMTGKHTGHAEIRGNMPAKRLLPQYDEGQYPLSEAAQTFPQLLQQAGYTTAAMGKWGLGPVGSTGDPNRKGFDLFFGYNCQSIAHSYYPSHLWRNAEKFIINRNPIPGHATQQDGEVRLDDWIGETYAPGLIVAEAEKFITDNSAMPFFLYLPFTQPHVAMHPPRESVEKFPAGWDQEPYRGQNGYLPHPRPRAAYAAMIHELDTYVGRILAALEKAGVSDRTLVVFTSDNGATHEGRADANFHVGGADPMFFNSMAGLRSFKGSVYEGGIRVPMIARFPGHIQPGIVNETPSYFADWFPTLCDVAELTKPPGLDGETIWPIMTGRQQKFENRKPMVWVFPEYGGQVAVRIGDFKVVRQRLATKSPGNWEVYDLSVDRGETHDLTQSRAEVVARALQILQREVAANDRFPLSIPGVSQRR
jgi:arylsulfatase A-like enzyme